MKVFAWNIAWAFLMGVVSSGHCVAMCGPIAAGLATQSTAMDWGKALRSCMPALFLKALSYAFLGLAAGLLGEVFVYSLRALRLQVYLPVLYIGILLLMATQILVPRFSLWRFSEPILSAPYRFLGQWLRSKDSSRRTVAGFLWGLIPCPAVMLPVLVSVVVTSQSIQSSQANIPTSAQCFVLMFVFGLGTIPSLTATAAGYHWIRQKLQKSHAPILGMAYLIAAFAIFWQYKHPTSTICGLN